MTGQPLPSDPSGWVQPRTVTPRYVPSHRLVPGTVPIAEGVGHRRVDLGGRPVVGEERAYATITGLRHPLGWIDAAVEVLRTGLVGASGRRTVFRAGNDAAVWEVGAAGAVVVARPPPGNTRGTGSHVAAEQMGSLVVRQAARTGAALGLAQVPQGGRNQCAARAVPSRPRLRRPIGSCARPRPRRQSPWPPCHRLRYQHNCPGQVLHPARRWATVRAAGLRG